MENIVTLGKLLSLWFFFLLHSILFLISQTSYRTYKIISSYDLARPLMGTIFLVFDRYCEYSIKSGTRCSRKSHVSREHQLCRSTPLPPQQVILTVTKYKTELIDMTCDELVSTVELSNFPTVL